MSKMTKKIEAAEAWKARHAEEGLDLKGLDAAFAQYQETRRKAGELKSQLKVVLQQGKKQGKEVAVVFEAVKGGRKLALKAKAVKAKLEAKTAKKAETAVEKSSAAPAPAAAEKVPAPKKQTRAKKPADAPQA